MSARDSNDETDRLSPTAQAVAQDLLLREADALDTQQWDDWLALYAEDAVFWVPAWIDDHQTTSDAEHQVSRMYHAGRIEIAERVMRIASNKSVTALPPPRTMHLVGPALISRASAGEMTVKANAAVHIYHPRSMKHDVTASRYEYRLKLAGSTWQIAAKTVTLINDCMPSVVDFYSV